jgi:hypothetical protein
MQKATHPWPVFTQLHVTQASALAFGIAAPEEYETTAAVINSTDVRVIEIRRFMS